MTDSFSNSNLKLKAEINELNAGLKCKEEDKVTLRSMGMCPMVLPDGLLKEMLKKELDKEGEVSE